MNPLTNIRNIAKLNEQELKLGIFDKDRSWHNQYKDSAYIFIGGLPYDLTEGDVLCVFSQYGEVVNINLVRDKATGKFKGYGFLAYEDQRSTILAVDNLNSSKLGGRTIRVDHVEEYRRPKEDEKDETGKFQEKEETGCAPQTPPESNTDDDDDDDDVSERDIKVKKRKKKEKKKRKKEGKQKRDKESKLNIKKELHEDELFDKMLMNKHIKKETEFTSGAAGKRDDVAANRKREDIAADRHREDIEEHTRNQDRPHHSRDRITDKDKHSYDEERSRGRVESPRRDRRDKDRQRPERPDNRSSKYRTRSRSRSRSRNRKRSRSPLRRR